MQRQTLQCDSQKDASDVGRAAGGAVRILVEFILFFATILHIEKS